MTTGELGLANDLMQCRTVEELTATLYAGVPRIIARAIVGFDLLDPETHDVRQTSASGVSSYFLARYDRFARRVDPVLNAAIDNRTVAHNLSMMTSDQWLSSPIYQDVFVLHRMTNVVYAPIVVDDHVVATLNLGRDDSAGHFTPQEIEQIGGIATLLGAVLGVLRRLDELTRRADHLASAVDLCDVPMVVSDLTDGTRHINRSAQAVLAGRPSEAPGLDEELARADPGGEGPAERTGALVKRSVDVGNGGLVTFLHGRSAADRLPGWLLTRVTAREADVILLVTQGYRDVEIAHRLMLSQHTVKGYLREVYRKLDVRSRVELTRLASVDDV